MKTLKLILFCILLISAKCFSQEYNLSAEVGQGFRFQSMKKPLIYVLNAGLKTTYPIAGNFNLGSDIKYVYYDTETELYCGPHVYYNIKDFSKEVKLGIAGSALYGTSGRKLFGGEIIFSSDIIRISVAGFQEYTDKEFWLLTGFGIDLRKIFKPEKK